MGFDNILQGCGYPMTILNSLITDNLTSFLLPERGEGGYYQKIRGNNQLSLTLKRDKSGAKNRKAGNFYKTLITFLQSVNNCTILDAIFFNKLLNTEYLSFKKISCT